MVRVEQQEGQIPIFMHSNALSWVDYRCDLFVVRCNSIVPERICTRYFSRLGQVDEFNVIFDTCCPNCHLDQQTVQSLEQLYRIPINRDIVLETLLWQTRTDETLTPVFDSDISQTIRCMSLVNRQYRSLCTSSRQNGSPSLRKPRASIPRHRHKPDRLHESQCCKN